MGLHLNPHPKDQLRGLAMSEKEFSVHHFLSLKCTCSEKLIEHLIVRKKTPNLQEIVHLIHPEKAVINRLEQAGFEVEAISEEESVKKFNLQALPLLVVKNKDQIVYQGGYARDQQHTNEYQDQKIIAQSLKQERAEEFLVLGCANGSLRKKMVDILGVKYERTE